MGQTLRSERNAAPCLLFFKYILEPWSSFYSMDLCAFHWSVMPPGPETMFIFGCQENEVGGQRRKQHHGTSVASLDSIADAGSRDFREGTRGPLSHRQPSAGWLGGSNIPKF